MTVSAELLWFAVFIWIGFTTEVATGFGSIIIALALGAMILPLETMLPVLVSLNVIMNGVLMIKFYRQVNRQVFLRGILPLMLLGMTAGILLFPYLPEQVLKLGFASLILWFASKELLTLGGKMTPATTSPRRPWLFLAGITHGLYASGGPLLVYSLAKSPLNKQAFRATLLATWLCLNLGYTLWFAVNGALITQLNNIIFMLPVLLLCALCGQILHKHINETQFKKLVYSLLLLCAVIMLQQSLTSLF